MGWIIFWAICLVINFISAFTYPIDYCNVLAGFSIGVILFRILPDAIREYLEKRLKRKLAEKYRD